MTRLPLALALIAAPAIAMAQTTDDADLTDACGASGLAGLVGQRGEIAEMLELEQPARVITPGSAVTMDYRLDRINFDIDEEGTITRVYCG
jgi:hypothetical protein